MTHSLTLGSLLLIDEMPEADHGYTLHVLAEGMSFGVAQGVQQVVQSLLADGDLVRITRYGNRQVTFRVEIEGPTLDALAQGEAALRREVGRPNTLTWQAPDIFAAPTVFEVITSEMSQTFDDLDELRRIRTFEITLTCAPFARSAEPVVVSALASGSTTTAVDTCDSATGWTATRGGAPDVAATLWEAGSIGVMELSNTVGFPPETWTLTRSGVVDFSSTPYLEAEVTTLSAKGGAPLSVSAHLDGSSTPLPVLQIRRLADGSGYFRATFDTGGASASSITFKHTSSAGYGHAWQGLQVRNLARTDVAPNITSQQATRVLEVAGTERTPGSLRIAAKDGTSPLRLLLVHTSKEDGSGNAPPLRRWRVSGNTELTTSGTVSGKLEALGPEYVHMDIPVSTLPRGGYQLMALLTPLVVGNYYIDVVVQSRQGGETIAFEEWGGYVPLAAVGDTWLAPLGVFNLPLLAANSGEIRVSIIARTGPGGPATAQVQFDDAWLFSVEEGSDLTIAVTDKPYFWIDTPTLSEPRYRFWEGSAADRSDARYPKALLAPGRHTFAAGRNRVFVASGAAFPEVSLEYYPRSPFNAPGST